MRELDDLLHTAHITASNMIHFTQQICYYINFEVCKPTEQFIVLHFKHGGTRYYRALPI